MYHIVAKQYATRNNTQHSARAEQKVEPFDKWAALTNRPEHIHAVICDPPRVIINFYRQRNDDLKQYWGWLNLHQQRHNHYDFTTPIIEI